MNIAIVSPFLPPRVGGIERHSRELASSLISQGHQVVVVTSRTTRFKPSPIPGSQILEFESLELFGRIPTPKINLGNWRKLQALRGLRFDAVIIQSHLFPICSVVAQIMRNYNCSRIWINHGSGSIPASGKIVNQLIYYYEKFQMRIMRKATTEIVSVSLKSAKWIESKTGVQSRVVSNGIPRAAAHLSHTKRTSKKTRILYAGRLLPQKGAMEALEIFVQALRELSILNKELASGTELLIVGSGPEFDRLLEAAKEQTFSVRLINGVEHEQLLVLMQESHIFLYPSTYPEGFPTVILEAASLGMAIVVGEKIAGMEDAIRHGAIQEGDKTQLIEIVKQLIMNQEEAIKWGQKAHEFFSENYNWETIASQIVRRSK